MQVYRNQQFVTLNIVSPPPTYMALSFLLLTSLRKHYKAVILDYTVLTTIIFLAFLN